MSVLLEDDNSSIDSYTAYTAIRIISLPPGNLLQVLGTMNVSQS